MSGAQRRFCLIKDLGKNREPRSREFSVRKITCDDIIKNDSLTPSLSGGPRHFVKAKCAGKNWQISYIQSAGVVELVDTRGLGPRTRKSVRVQVSPPAL